MQNIIKKADVLIEALPYIRRFKGTFAVIKAGGSMMEDKDIIRGILEDIIFLNLVGIKPVLIHGGGPRINERMKHAGLKPKFVDGLRVTDLKTMKIVDETLDKANAEIANHIKELGGKAKALCGKRDKIIKAEKLKHKGKDIGYVGKIVFINTSPIKKTVEAGMIPVISPVGFGTDGNAYNVNGDQAASEIAATLKARKLVLLTDTKGILRDESDEETLIPTLKRKDVDVLIKRGIIQSGMIPKVRAAVMALNKGVKKTHIIDGRLNHAILLEIFTDKGIGTQIIK